MKIKITNSSGRGGICGVINAETGSLLEGIEKIVITADQRTAKLIVEITFLNPEIDLECEA